MKKGICFFVLFTLLSSCALLRKKKVTDVILNNENLLESQVSGDISNFVYMRTEAPFDSVLVQFMFQESSPDIFECHMIKGKYPYNCDPWMRDNWKVNIQKNMEKNEAVMNAEAYFICENKKYRLLVSYNGVLHISPGIEPH